MTSILKKHKDQYKMYLQEHKENIIKTHIDPLKGKGAKQLVLEILPLVANKYKWESGCLSEYISQTTNTISGHNYFMTVITNFLKEENVYQKRTRGTIDNQKNSLFKKYGVVNPGQLLSNKKRLSERNKRIVYKIQSEGYQVYYKKVIRLTDKIKRNWLKKGFPKIDYYTGLPFLNEMCNPNLMQGDLYPTIDHKLSCFYCFHNNIPEEVCAGESNLCWTFRWLNSRKGDLTENIFIEHVLPSFLPILKKEIELLIGKGLSPCE